MLLVLWNGSKWQQAFVEVLILLLPVAKLLIVWEESLLMVPAALLFVIGYLLVVSKQLVVVFDLAAEIYLGTTVVF